MTASDVDVGKYSVAVQQAEATVRRYVNHEDGVYSWPSYDRLDTGNQPDRLSDGDLLAPVLLNVKPSIRAYQGLVAKRQAIEERLRLLPHDLDLADATDDQVRDVASLYEVLDTSKIPGVQGTTLSKVLHRKRPRLVPLHDAKIRAVYVGPDAPVPFAEDRPWTEYMAVLARAMRDDLRGGTDAWSRMAGLADGLTPLRALDIMAWSISDAPDDGNDAGPEA